jgi:hypothetical protein
MAPVELAMLSGLAQIVQRLNESMPLRYLPASEVAGLFTHRSTTTPASRTGIFLRAAIPLTVSILAYRPATFFLRLLFVGRLWFARRRLWR